MARHTFGNGAADWVFSVDPADDDALPTVSTAIIFFDAITGGNPITDLLDNTGTAVTSVTTDTNGFLPAFSGPDTAPNDTRRMAADANGGAGPRVWIFATDTSADIDAAAATANAAVNMVNQVSAQAPVFVYYNPVSAGYPVRPNVGAAVWWVGPVPPVFGSGFAQDGLDFWIGPQS